MERCGSFEERDRALHSTTPRATAALMKLIHGVSPKQSRHPYIPGLFCGETDTPIFQGSFVERQTPLYSRALLWRDAEIALFLESASKIEEDSALLYRMGLCCGR